MRMLSLLAKAGLIAAASAAMTGGAWAQSVVLRMSTHLPANSLIVKEFFEPWAKRVNDEGEGVLRIRLEYGPTLSNFGNSFDRVNSDVVQIGWMLPVLVGGRFPLAEATALPYGEHDLSAVLSPSFWQLLQTSALQKEFAQVVPLWVGVATGSPIHFSKPVKAYDDYSGLTINITGSRFQSEAISLLGGTPASFATEELFEALQRGTIRGAITSWSGFGAFRLGEVAKYHLEVPLGGNPHIFFMSRAKFDSLPEKARAILVKNTGKEQSRAFGAFLDREAALHRDKVVGAKDHEIVRLDAGQSAAFRQKLQPLIARWSAEHPERPATIEAFKTLVAEEAKASGAVK